MCHMQVSVSRGAMYGPPTAKHGPSGSAYVTYRRADDAERCIKNVHLSLWHGTSPSWKPSHRHGGDLTWPAIWGCPLKWTRDQTWSICTAAARICMSQSASVGEREWRLHDYGPPLLAWSS